MSVWIRWVTTCWIVKAMGQAVATQELVVTTLRVRFLVLAGGMERLLLLDVESTPFVSMIRTGSTSMS